MYGLLDRDFHYMKEVFDDFPEIESIVLFGSRAMGNYKKASDIDIAIKGENITHTIITRISGILNEEKPIPYFFDILNYNTISNIELKKHIDEKGVILYSLHC